ncbi:hypothetical protein AAE02nite_22900 [Adhaeribacter aerolatus]|uniref:Methyltransferase FkbM domain-containing protein n=1 Tax=Adhaeribacter aerolatus TaxID=670289 RepID=A0A512AY30_9BACT|nr:hypothetical protein [Adhaeribacter aerolatus]GEO04626.1 hypothetical protein AAE02nite_22900 [Adhaeribacter aerolatus]
MIAERLKKLLKGKNRFSNLGEEAIISDFLKQLDHKKIAVDIAANDGVFMSNTYHLYNSGYGGLAVECDDKAFASLAHSYMNFKNVSLSKAYVYPDNVVNLLQGYEIPYDFGFLSFDIDGYDYYVLKALLQTYRPTLICAEINEKIPYPLKFTVKYSRDYVWEANHFYGQSIGQLYLLCEEFDYDLIQVHYNNAFLVPKEKNKSFKKLEPGQAYQEGYVNKPDRTTKFPYNKDVDALLDMSPEKALDFINEYFKQYKGKYEAHL